MTTWRSRPPRYNAANCLVRGADPWLWGGARVRQEWPLARSTTFLPEGLHMTSFRNSSSYLLTSESVTEGHPDKVCDQVSAAVLDAILEQAASARWAVRA